MAQMANGMMKKVGTYVYNEYLSGNGYGLIQKAMQDDMLSSNATAYILLYNNTDSSSYAVNAIVFISTATTVSAITSNGGYGYYFRNNWNNLGNGLTGTVRADVGTTCDIYRIDH